MSSRGEIGPSADSLMNGTETKHQESKCVYYRPCASPIAGGTISFVPPVRRPRGWTLCCRLLRLIARVLSAFFFYSLYSSFVFLLDLFVSSRPHITLSTLLFLHGCKKKQKLAIICKLIVPTTFPVVRCPKSSPHHIFRIRFCFLTSVIYFLHFPLPLLPNSTPSPLPSPFTVPPIIHVLLGAHFPFSSESPWVLLLTSWSLVAFFTFSSFLITYI